MDIYVEIYIPVHLIVLHLDRRSEWSELIGKTWIAPLGFGWNGIRERCTQICSQFFKWYFLTWGVDSPCFTTRLSPTAFRTPSPDKSSCSRIPSKSCVWYQWVSEQSLPSPTSKATSKEEKAKSKKKTSKKPQAKSKNKKQQAKSKSNKQSLPSPPPPALFLLLPPPFSSFLVLASSSSRAVSLLISPLLNLSPSLSGGTSPDFLQLCSFTHIWAGCGRWPSNYLGNLKALAISSCGSMPGAAQNCLNTSSRSSPPLRFPPHCL